MSETRLVQLTKTYDVTQAHILSTFLQSYDIPCTIMDDHSINTAWHLSLAIGGVRVMVPAKNYKDAAKLLASHTPPQTSCVTKSFLPESTGGKLAFLFSFAVTLYSGLPFILKGRKAEKDQESRPQPSSA